MSAGTDRGCVGHRGWRNRVADDSRYESNEGVAHAFTVVDSCSAALAAADSGSLRSA